MKNCGRAPAKGLILHSDRGRQPSLYECRLWPASPPQRRGAVHRAQGRLLGQRRGRELGAEARFGDGGAIDIRQIGTAEHLLCALDNSLELLSAILASEAS